MIRTTLVCVLLIGATLAAYWPATQPGFDFVDLDDSDYARNNQHVRDGLTLEGVKWAITSTDYANWFPVTWLSLMLDAELWGPPGNPGPRGFHITNIALHVINTLLLLGVLRSFTGAFWRSALVAALFALHPMHVESVAWVSERKDVLSTMFLLLTMWAYVWWVRGNPRRWEKYVLVMLLLGLGLMSKSMLVTLPCVLLLMDYWPLGRVKFGGVRMFDPPAEPGANGLTRQVFRLFVEKLPLFGLVAASSVMTMIAQRASGAMPEMSKRLTLVNVPMSYVRYIGKTFWPADMAAYYPIAGAAGCPAWQVWQVIGAAALLGVITLAALVVIRRAPWFIVGWLWFVGTMVPVIGLVQVGSQGMADRYTYVPYIGLFIIIAWGAGEIVERARWMRTVMSAFFIAALAVFIPVTRAQVLVWKDTETLYLHTLQATGPNWRVRDFLAGYYVAVNRLPEALEHYRIALELRRDDPETNFKTGWVLATMGLNAEARERFEEVIRLDPDFADAHFNLALVLSRRGEIGLAKLHLKRAMELNPAGAEFYRQNLQLP